MESAARDRVRMYSRNHLLHPSDGVWRPPVRAFPAQIRLYSAELGARLPEEPFGISSLSCFVPAERKGGEHPLEWTICLDTESRGDGGAADAKGLRWR